MESNQPLQKIIDAKEQAIHQLLAYPGVTGVDVGYRYVQGQMTKEICLRVHVAKKLPDLAPAERIPPYINGIATDVIEGRYKTYGAVTTAADVNSIDDETYDVLEGGISISGMRDDQSADTGTLGLVVVDRNTGKPAVLTNAHVVGGENTVGKKMYQPYPWNNRPFGSVLRARRSGSIDAALISIDQMSYSFDIMQLGGVQGVNPGAQLGQSVRKRGRQSRLTYGIVEGVHGTFPISETESYDDIISIKPVRAADFSIEGDSGSVIVDDDNRVVALLYAGYPSELTDDPTVKGRTLSLPIQNVMNAMNCSVSGSENKPAPPPQPPSANRPTLKIGTRGPAVMDLQQMLAALGFGITPDGVFGQRTMIAIKVYQMHNNLNSDGVVGPATWASIAAAAANAGQGAVANTGA